MKLPGILKAAEVLLKKNQPQILMGVAIGGVVSTAYLAARGTWQARDIIDAYESENGVEEHPVDRLKERAKQVWPVYVPMAISGFGTVTCIVFAQRSQMRRTAAAVVAYTVTEKAFSDYREKVAETFGKTKDQKVRDAVVQDRVNARPPTEQVVFVGKGEVLCLELYTHRYFKSDMETLRRSMNDINEQLNHQVFGTLNDFYERVGLPQSSAGEVMGWEDTKQMELEFSTAMAPDGTPCIAFDYNYVKSLWA